MVPWSPYLGSGTHGRPDGSTPQSHSSTGAASSKVAQQLIPRGSDIQSGETPPRGGSFASVHRTAMNETPIIFTEDAVAYSLFKHRLDSNSRLFFKFNHNMSIRRRRPWFYYCAPDVDVIEVTPDHTVIAYELKGSRMRRTVLVDFPAIHDPIGQAVAYLDLPRIYQGERRLFLGGGFDHVYAVCAKNPDAVDFGERKLYQFVSSRLQAPPPDGPFPSPQKNPEEPNTKPE